MPTRYSVPHRGSRMSFLSARVVSPFMTHCDAASPNRLRAGSESNTAIVGESGFNSRQTSTSAVVLHLTGVGSTMERQTICERPETSLRSYKWRGLQIENKQTQHVRFFALWAPDATRG